MPVFLPTTLQGAEEIIESIKELKNSVTSDLQPVTEKLHEDQKEGTFVPLTFSLFDFSFTMFFTVNFIKCLFLPTQ